jgi:glycogen debranching enzyme
MTPQRSDWLLLADLHGRVVVGSKITFFCGLGGKIVRRVTNIRDLVGFEDLPVNVTNWWMRRVNTIMLSSLQALTFVY